MLSTWDRLCKTWCEIDVPEGYRPQITNDGIYMEPPRWGIHTLIVESVTRSLVRSRLLGYGVFPALSIGVEEAEAIYVPDICVAPRAAVPVNSEPVPADVVELIVEVTSAGTAHLDRDKIRTYAIGGVRRYLLIDPHGADGLSVTLFADPSDGVYASTVSVPFGEPVKLGDPFDVDVDTSRF